MTIEPFIISDTIYQKITTKTTRLSYKESLYDYIDKLEKNDTNYSYFYIGFKLLVLKIVNKNDEDLIRLYELSNDIQQAIIISLSNLFREFNKSDYLSSFDKDAIQNYAEHVKGYLLNQGWMSKAHLNQDQRYFSQENGKVFDDWLLVWNHQAIANQIHYLIHDEEIKQDSHRYKEPYVGCILAASTSNNFAKAISDCQYIFHGDNSLLEKADDPSL